MCRTHVRMDHTLRCTHVRMDHTLCCTHVRMDLTLCRACLAECRTLKWWLPGSNYAVGPGGGGPPSSGTAPATQPIESPPQEPILLSSAADVDAFLGCVQRCMQWALLCMLCVLCVLPGSAFWVWPRRACVWAPNARFLVRAAQLHEHTHGRPGASLSVRGGGRGCLSLLGMPLSARWGPGMALSVVGALVWQRCLCLSGGCRGPLCLSFVCRVRCPCL